MIPGEKVAALDLEHELSPRPSIPHIGMALGSGTESGLNEVSREKENRSVAGLS
jgi:hypothetical protein